MRPMKSTHAEALKEPREHPTPVKLGDLRPRLDRAALTLRTNRSAIIRMALLSKLDEIDSGFIRIPKGARL